MKHRLLARTLVAAAAALAGLSAQAAIVGSSVSGSLIFGTGAANYFSPSNGFVPAGYSNTASNSVVIGDPAKDFGFFDGSNLDTADFTNNQLYISDTVYSAGVNPWTMTFTAGAGVFTSISLVTSNFAPGLTYGLVGNTIVVSFTGGASVQPGYQLAVFNLNSVAAVPEPGSAALMLAGMGAVGWLARRRRQD